MVHYTVLSLILFFCAATMQADVVKIPSVAEKNKEADRAFIKWKIEAPHSSLSQGLRDILTVKAVEYLVQESQLPFNKVPSQQQLFQKINSLTDEFIKKFNPGKKKVSQEELRSLIHGIIVPEYVFLGNKEGKNDVEYSYNQLLKALSVRKTRIGTTLEDWALRFLTSESIMLALPIIERIEIRGRGFNELTPNEQKQALQPVIELITQRFINNLRAVREKFQFSLPVHVDMAIRHKITQFLQEKFIKS